MAALNTDKLKKLSRRWVGQIGSGGVADDTATTIPLSSTTNLATDTAVVATIDRVDANGTATPNLEETVIGVVSGSNLVNCVRGSEGTAQAHSAGAVVEILVTAKGWNDLVDHLLVQHDQLGYHTNITASNISASAAVTSLHYDLLATGDIRDANDNELLKFTQTASAVNEFTVANTATGNGPSLCATGGDSNIDLNLVAKGTGNVTMGSDLDIANFSVKNWDGWIESEDTWTYASATTFTISGVDRTAMFPKGTKLKLTQTTAKYFYVVASAFSTDTTITVTGGSDYSLANAAITSPYYSYASSPQGFPQWFNYIPTWTAEPTNPVLGSSTLVGRFSLNGQICTVRFGLTITTGGAFSAGSGLYRWAIPIAAAAGIGSFGIGKVFDAGTEDFAARVEILASGTYMLMAIPKTSLAVTNSLPMTPATGDSYSGTITYEI